MVNQETLLAVMDASDHRRAERRRFLRFAGAAGMSAGGLALLSACGNDDDDNGVGTPSPNPTPSPTASPSPVFSEGDVLNFALNLEYLEATFYSYAAFGTDLPAGSVGASGAVIGGRRVNFTDPVVAQYAREIARDEIAHVNFLRTAIGSTAVPRPRLNIDGTNSGAFTLAARAAGVVGANETFDPYSSDEFFLLGAFIFEDVGVTAYKGGISFLNTPSVIEATAGIYAAEAYHAGLIRTVLYGKGVDTPLLRTASTAISDARDQLDGSGSDLDQPIVGSSTVSNIVPADTNAIAFARTPGQVLNIVYLNKAGVVGGGFFPNGVNGTIRSSTAQP